MLREMLKFGNVKIWNKIDFGHIFQNKEEIIDQLCSIQDLIQQEGYNDQVRIKEKSILTNLHNIIGKEELFWKQRSRINWVKVGD